MSASDCTRSAVPGPKRGTMERPTERRNDTRNDGGPVLIKTLVEQYNRRQAERNDTRNDNGTAPVPLVPGCFTLFRKVAHLTDAQAAEVVGRELARPGWSVADWRAFFDERAGIAEHDGGLDRPQAERQAFTECVRQFLRRHPPGYRPDLLCLHCGGTLVDGTMMPVVFPDNLQRWIHHGCVADFNLLRIRDAVLCLDRLGIVDPVGALPDGATRPFCNGPTGETK